MYNWGWAAIISIFILFLLLCLPCSAVVVDERTEIIYGDGWIHYNYTDGTHAHKLTPNNYLRWDGEWRPKTEMNLSSGDWPYLVEEFDTYHFITRLDDSLNLSKTYQTYDFQPYKIGVQFTLTPSQLNDISTYHNVGGTNYWYITIPQSLKQTMKHLNWDNKLPIIYNETGFILNRSDNISGEWLPNYKYKNVGGELRLYYNQVARCFGISSTEITFNFNSYIINSSTGWANTSYDINITTVRGNGNLELQDAVPDYISYWRFKDNSILDENTTSSNDGVNYGVVYSDSQQAFEFNGSGSNIKIPYSNSLLFGNSFTIIYQFNITVDQSGGLWWDQSSNMNRIFYGAANNQLIADYRINSVGKRVTTSINSVLLSTDYHSALVYTGSSMYLVLDGVNHTPISCSGLVTNDGSNDRISGIAASGTFYLDGLISSKRVYNRALSTIEINQTRDNCHEVVGNVTHWHDAGAGYQTASFIINMTTPSNTNYTVWYANNGSSFTQIGGVYTGNQTPSIGGTKYQNSDLRIIINGNSTATPEEIEVVFVTEALAAGNPPNITSWQNNKSSNDSLDITINIGEDVNFNATANQTITTWNWYKDDVDQSHNYNNITLNWSSTGLKYVIVNATNSNGTSSSIQWNVTVVGTGYTVSGTIYGAAGLGEGQVTVTLGSHSTTTSSSGAYSFSGVSAGTYTLSASKPGLQDASTTITVSSDTTQDLTMARAVSPDGGGQDSSDWGLPFNISGPLSRLDGLFAQLQVPSDPGKINLFWYCILGFGAFMFIDGTTFRFDNSRKAPVIKLKYLISAPLSLILMFLGLMYIGLINWNSVFFISTFDGLGLSFSSAISSLLGVTSPLGAVGYVLVGTGILVLGVLIFIDGLAFCVDKSRENTFLKIKYQVLIAAGLGLGVLGAAVSGLIIFY